MPRPLKRPDGELIEEFVASTAHLFEGGTLVGHDNAPEIGDYTGRFYFRYAGGKMTRWYTTKTAPKWLLALFLEATTDRSTGE